MSEFGHDIFGNDAQESQLEEPLTFEQLDCLTDSLIRETIEAEADFRTKAPYVVQRDVQTSQNHEDLMNLNEHVQNCAYNLNVVESEVQEQGNMLQEIAEIVNTLEARQNGVFCAQGMQTDVAAIVGVMEKLDSEMVQQSADIEKINEYIAAHTKEPTTEGTQKVFTSIMSLHLDLLLQVERSLTRLEENSYSIGSQLEFLEQMQPPNFQG